MGTQDRTKRDDAPFWRCRICGLIVQGTEPPALCPICGAGREYFVEVGPPKHPADMAAFHADVEMTTELVEDVAVVALAGRLDYKGCAEIEASFLGAAPHVTRMAVDLGRVEYLASIGIQLLIQKARALHKRRGALALFNVPGLVRHSLTVAKLDAVLPMVETREDALAKLRQP